MPIDPRLQRLHRILGAAQVPRARRNHRTGNRFRDQWCEGYSLHRPDPYDRCAGRSPDPVDSNAEQSRDVVHLNYRLATGAHPPEAERRGLATAAAALTAAQIAFQQHDTSGSGVLEIHLHQLTP
jgi:hypothetical protein